MPWTVFDRQLINQARARYVRDNYQADINDCLLHHLVINTDAMPLEAAAQVIAGAAGKRFIQG